MKKLLVIIFLLVLVIIGFGQYKYENSQIIRVASFNGCIEDNGFPDNILWGGVMCSYAKLNMSKYVNIDSLHTSNLYWAVEGMINGEHHDQGLHNRSKAMVERLLSYGQNINQSNNCGETVLHAPIMTKSPKTVEFLLASGADPKFDFRSEECEVIGDRSPLELSMALKEKYPNESIYVQIFKQLKANNRVN